ncbi:transmembrane electron transport protein [Thermococcus sp. 4557]|uniref:cytochrome c biogenesis CcdA family protein n=1 Tax=Thermococcus sp. (strain CGMCC 1.5172 / 4557) TaxID=1042877 RepID=UPI000219EECF|nr:cytochrome c biogenesis CcdA family protein [Thermococcus sp. 4557]AEK72467.1 transmembrane electron transport protein [Thermococcus sp. 4557]
MRSEIKGLALIVLASFGISSLALWALGMTGFIPQFFTLAMTDSINPCTFVIYTMLLIALSVREVSKRRLYLIGAAFIAAVYISYYLLGVGLLYFAGYLPLWVAGVAAIIFGAYTIVTGLMEKSRIADKKGVKKRIFSSDATAVGAFTLGIIVSTTLLPCSAGSYLVYAIIISKAGKVLAFLLLALYNLVFVLPLVIILLAMGSVTESKRFSQAMVRRSRELSVVAGILLIAIGVWVLTGASL